MSDSPAQSTRANAWTDVSFATVRALRSLVIIVVLVGVTAILRRGRFAWSSVNISLTANRTLFMMIFFALWIWEFWFQRTRRRSAPPGVR